MEKGDEEGDPCPYFHEDICILDGEIKVSDIKHFMGGDNEIH